MIRCLSIATVLTGMAITLNAQNMKPLTPEEERVIVRKGTEAPFSGKYYLHDEDGTYRCRRCGAPLYRSQDKFEPAAAGPASMMKFRVPCAANRMPTDAVRRFSAPSAGAHLGHVFTDEDLPLKYAPLREFPLPRFRTGRPFRPCRSRTGAASAEKPENTSSAEPPKSVQTEPGYFRRRLFLGRGVYAG